MRIYSSTTWLLSASLAKVVVGSGITFNIDGFNGVAIPFDNGILAHSTILNTTKIENGNNGKGQWMITWTKANNVSTINNVFLATRDKSGISIAYGKNSQSTTSGHPSLLFGRDPIPQTFPVDFIGGSLTLEQPFVASTLAGFQNKALFFQVEWIDDKGSTGYSYSLPWALVGATDIAEASKLLSSDPSLVTSGSPVFTDGPSPTVTTGTMPTTTGTGISNNVSSSSSSASTAATASSSAASSGSKGKSGGLSTGSIVGIAVGVVAALMIASIVAGCLCFRRRRGRGANGEDGNRDVRAMQDMMAEKEARVGILEGDQPDTPYSERAAPNPLGRGLGLSGLMNESGVDMGVGQAVSADGVVPCEGHYTDWNDRNSGVYATPVVDPTSGANSSPTHPHPHPSSAIQQHPSVPCASTQQDRAFTPYTDHPAPGTTVGGLPPCKQQQQKQKQQQHGYSQQQQRQQQQQHHHVVDGAGLVHQEQEFGDEPARAVGPDGHQPISPDSAGGSTPRLREAAFGSRSATPSGISGRYAHLVEEGMTDDEIRRLEEEERALDEAIEQHGRGR